MMPSHAGGWKGPVVAGPHPQRLYGVKHPADALPDTSYVKNFYDRTRDLIDQHNPDLLYFDDSLLPLAGRDEHRRVFYNNSVKTHASWKPY